MQRFTESQRIIAGIWKELLKVDRVELDDDFFELGGHSLLVAYLAVEVREKLGVDFSLELFYQFSSLRSLATEVDRIREGRRWPKELAIPVRQAVPLLDVFPKGKLPVWLARQHAGVMAKDARNIPYGVYAGDRVYVLTVFRSQIYLSADGICVKIFPLLYSLPGQLRDSKRAAVARDLAALSYQWIRLVIAEDRSKPFKARYDAGGEWQVVPVEGGFELWRQTKLVIPETPTAFGTLTPKRKLQVSDVIERDPRVVAFTLERANYRCEVPDCTDQYDYPRLDVHHVIRLGDGGADHTDNTVCLCVYHHNLVHRGNVEWQDYMERKIGEILARRSPAIGCL